MSAFSSSDGSTVLQSQFQTAWFMMLLFADLECIREVVNCRNIIISDVAVTFDVLNNTQTLKLHNRKLNIHQETAFIQEKNSNFNQDNNILLNNLENTNITNSIKNINIKFHFPNNKTSKKMKDIMLLSFNPPLLKGTKYILYMEYNGTMNTKVTHGIYCRKYFSHNRNQTYWISSASFEPHYARTAFPCWDEPEHKANFTISIVHSNDSSSISNMPLRATEYVSGRKGWLMDTFETTPKMSTYLVSFLVSQYKSKETYVTKQKKIRIWAPEHKIQYADLALMFGQRHIKFFEDYFDIVDPLPKIDFISIRHYIAGGLENWGIISFEEKLLLLDKKARNSRTKLMLSCDLIAHELAHIWFGNLVTPKWWDDIWLNEGFANYFAILAVEQFKPKWEYKLLSTLTDMIHAFEVDSNPSSRPLVSNDVSENNVSELFDDISYKKGALIVRMLNYTLGEVVFKQGIQNYLKRRLYKTASHDELWNSLTEAAHREKVLSKNVTVNNLMHKWIHESGHPILIVTRNYRNGEITISQESVIRSDKKPVKWWIPITFTHESDTKIDKTEIKFWFDPSHDSITFKDPASPKEWIVFNIDVSGFYRVRYDRHNQELLIKAILSGDETIPIMNKAKIIQDTVYLSRSGQTTVNQVLDIVSSFRSEDSPHLWIVMLKSLSKLYVPLIETNVGYKFQEYMKSIVGPEFERIGLQKFDAPHKRILSEWACELISIDTCIKDATILFTAWHNQTFKNNVENFVIPSESRQTVFCVAVKYNGLETWKFMKTYLLNTKDLDERQDILRGMACSTNNTVIQNYLEWVLDESNNDFLNNREKATAIKAIAKNNIDLTLDYIVSDPDIQAKLCSKKFRLKKLMESFTNYITTEKQLSQLNQIINNSANMLRYKGRVDGITEMAQTTLKWISTNKLDIEKWLNKHIKTSRNYIWYNNKNNNKYKFNYYK